MTTPEPKEYGVPAGAMRPGDLGKLQNINGDSINWGQLTGITAAAEEARNGFVAGLRESIVRPLQQVFAGLKPPGWEKVADAFQDGQLALTNRLDLLSPLLDYGTAYMSQKGGFLEFNQNSGPMPFNNQLGPMRGCELDDGGIRLKARGLWDIRAQMTFENTALSVGSGHVDWRVIVYRPDGGEYSRQRGIVWNQKTITSTIVSSVVVPEPGYLVKIEITWIHGSRRLPGGPEYNRLTCQHISNRVDAGAMGNEASPDLDTSGERG